MKLWLSLLLLSLFVSTTSAQVNIFPSSTQFSGTPTGACTVPSFAVNTLTGDLYDCLGGSWHQTGNSIKPATSDAVQFVSPNGSDANDGLSFGTAKATVGGALSATSCSGGNCQIVITGNLTIATAINLTVAGVSVTCSHDDTLTKSADVPIFSISAANWSLTGCILDGNSQQGTNSGINLNVGASGATISGNTIRNMAGQGIFATGSVATPTKHVQIIGNHFSGNKSIDISLNATMTDVQVQGNQIDDSSQSFTNLAGIEALTTSTGNILSNVRVLNNDGITGTGSSAECITAIANGGDSASLKYVITSSNTCTVSANGAGCYSFAELQGGSISSNNCNAGGFNAFPGGVEVDDSVDVAVSSNVVRNVGAAATGVPFFAQGDQNCTWSGNVVDSFAATGANAAGFALQEFPAIPSRTTINNAFTGNVVNFPASGAGVGFRISTSNAADTVSNNSFVGNLVTGVGVSGSACFQFTNTSGGTVQNNSIEGNLCRNIDVGISIGGTVSTTHVQTNTLLSAVTALFSDGGTNTLIVDYNGVPFTSLGSQANGSVVYSNNSTIANPCAGGGTGAIAKRLNGVWVCN